MMSAKSFELLKIQDSDGIEGLVDLYLCKRGNMKYRLVNKDSDEITNEKKRMRRQIQVNLVNF